MIWLCIKLKFEPLKDFVEIFKYFFFRRIRHQVPELRQFKVRSKLYSLFWINGGIFRSASCWFSKYFLNWYDFLSSWTLNYLTILLKSFNGKFFRSYVNSKLGQNCTVYFKQIGYFSKCKLLIFKVFFSIVLTFYQVEIWTT